MRFIAQSLDNNAPMLVAIGRDVTAEDDPRRRAALDDSSAVIGRGSEQRLSESVVMYHLAAQFALEITPERRDDEGRQAPIIAVIEASEVGGEGWADSAVEVLAGFAEAAHRPLDAARREEVLAGLHAVKKKSSFLRSLRTLVVVVALFALALALLWRRG